MLEICVDSVASALAAAAGGAQRLELCAALSEGGLTPPGGLFQTVKKYFKGPVMFMVRPHGGDFLYTDPEYEAMGYDIDEAKRLGADGVVLGILTADGRVDLPRTRALVERAAPLPVTFHRAFDMSRDPIEALENLIEIGVQRVLTSGQAVGVYEGRKRLSQLVKQAGDRIIVMPGAGITPGNFAEIIRTVGAREYHAAALGWQESAMQYHNTQPSMGEAERSEFRWKVCDASEVRQLREILDHAHTAS